LVVNKVPMTGTTINALPSLRLIAVTATGHNVVDSQAARTRGIHVSNVPEYGTNTVAQFTFALILELCHQVGRHAQWVADGHWQESGEWCRWLTPQTELSGKVLGIVGFGRIGRRVGELANAFGMHVAATPSKTAQPPVYQPFQWMPMEQIFSEADIVTLHCPLTESNKQMVNRELLHKMKTQAFLINTSRGGLINERDLADHLNSGSIAGAAVDVASVEPILPSNPLLQAKNCIITPHMAWTTLEARQRIMQVTAANIAAFASGKPMNVVNL
jgi:glycerate dehydrogenase